MLSANINGVWRSSVLGGDLSTGPLLSLLGGVTCTFSSQYKMGYDNYSGDDWCPKNLTYQGPT